MIPAFGLGTWVFGGRDWGGQRREDSIATLKSALDAGVRHLDVAQAYGGGLAEEIVGEVIGRRTDRHELFVASKTFTKTPAKLRELIDRSRIRLQRDHIDLYYLHWPRRKLDLRPLLAELEAACQRGWIGGVGVSNFSVTDLEAIKSETRIDAVQLGWNLIWRQQETEVIGHCLREGIPVVAYSALAQGVLTGKFSRTPQFPEGDFRPRTVPFRTTVWPHVHAFVEEAKAACRDHAISLPRAAMAWLLAQGATAVLGGARTPAQLQDLLPIPDLPPALNQRLTQLSNGLQEKLPAAPNFFDYQP